MEKIETQYGSEGKKGFRSGCIAGVFIAVFMISAAIASFEDGSIYFGFFFVFLGIASLLIGYNQGSNMISGACPFCGHKIITFKNQLSTKCKACRKRIVIKDNKFLGIY